MKQNNTQNNASEDTSLNAAMLQSLLFLHAKSDNIKGVQSSIDLGTNLEAKDDTGRTALILAARYGKAKSLDLLIKNNVNIHAKDKYGENALTLATVFNNSDCIDRLIKAGADEVSSEKQLHSVYLKRWEYRENLKTTLEKIQQHKQPSSEELEKRLRESNMSHVNVLKARQAPALKRRPRP